MKNVTLTVCVLIAFIASCMLTSCGDGYTDGKAKEMMEKDYKGKLQKNDYAQMLEWYEANQNEYFDKWADILNDEKNYIDYQARMREMEVDMMSDCQYMVFIARILMDADEGDMGSANAKKYNKLMEKYIERAEKLSKKAPKNKSKKKIKSSMDDIDIEDIIGEEITEEVEDLM